MPKPLKNMLDVRHEARKIALQTLFEASFRPCDLLEVADRIRRDQIIEGVDDDLLRAILTGVEEHRPQIDTLIARCAPEWPFHQLAKIDVNILRIAIYELYIASSVPTKVAVDEAVELAKEFGSDSTSAFVNGALGTIVKFKEQGSRADTALFIGSFQPLHRGHTRAIRHIAARFPKIIIGIYAADLKHTHDNPLSYVERRRMLEEILSTISLKEDEREIDTPLPDVHFSIVPLPHLTDKAAWLTALHQACPTLDVVYTNCPVLENTLQEENIPVFHAQLHEPKELNSAEIRRRIILGHPWSKLVPMKVERFLKHHHLVDRIREIMTA